MGALLYLPSPLCPTPEPAASPPQQSPGSRELRPEGFYCQRYRSPHFLLLLPRFRTPGSSHLPASFTLRPGHLGSLPLIYPPPGCLVPRRLGSQHLLEHLDLHCHVPRLCPDAWGPPSSPEARSTVLCLDTRVPFSLFSAGVPRGLRGRRSSPDTWAPPCPASPLLPATPSIK